MDLFIHDHGVELLKTGWYHAAEIHTKLGVVRIGCVLLVMVMVMVMGMPVPVSVPVPVPVSVAMALGMASSGSRCEGGRPRLRGQSG